MSEEINREDMIESVARLFKTLSDPNRKSLIGAKIDDILSVYFDRIDTNQLASALISKYGSDLFKKKTNVLETIVNRMDLNEIKRFSNDLNIPVKNDIYDDVVSFVNDRSALPKILEYFELPKYFLIEKETDDRKTEEVIDIKYNQNLVSLGFPHPYQNNVKLELLERLHFSSGNFFALIVMPTGSGKTRTAVEFMIDYIRNRKSSNILWLVESPELAEQSLKSFKDLWELRGDRKIIAQRCFTSNFSPVIDSTKGTNVIFSGFKKLDSLKKQKTSFYQSIKNQTNLLIIDEAHFALAETYGELIRDIELNSKDICKVGLTATPMRPDDDEFYSLKKSFNDLIIDFKDDQNEIIKNPLSYLQDKGYLARIETEYLSIPEDEIKENSQELNNKVIARLEASVEEGKQIIVFAMSKDHAIALDILLKDKKLKTGCIIGDTLSQDRQQFFNDFTNKKINILINFGILSTGIDLPKVDELFLLRKFGEYTTAMQVLGRALRGKLNGGNDKNKIISIKGNKEIIDDANDLYNLIKNMY